jgi:hypothetical protein
MTKKSIYQSSELPDGTLEEFEHVTCLFLMFIEELQKKYSLVSINAGMSKAMLDMLYSADKEKIKQTLLNQAEYFRLASERVNKE